MAGLISSRNNSGMGPDVVAMLLVVEVMVLVWSCFCCSP